MLEVLGLALDRGDPGIIPVSFDPLAPRVGYRLVKNPYFSSGQSRD
jgi:hypothetical protein